MDIDIKKEITIKMTIDDARAIWQDTLDIDPSRINLETIELRDILKRAIDND